MSQSPSSNVHRAKMCGVPVQCIMCVGLVIRAESQEQHCLGSFLRQGLAFKPWLDFNSEPPASATQVLKLKFWVYSIPRLPKCFLLISD